MVCTGALVRRRPEEIKPNSLAGRKLHKGRRCHLDDS
jgi:hypothetical protein